MDESLINHRKRHSPSPKVHSPAVISRLCIESDKLGMARPVVDDAISYHRRRQLRCGVKPTTPALSAGVRVQRHNAGEVTLSRIAGAGGDATDC